MKKAKSFSEIKMGEEQKKRIRSPKNMIKKIRSSTSLKSTSSLSSTLSSENLEEFNQQFVENNETTSANVPTTTTSVIGMMLENEENEKDLFDEISSISSKIGVVNNKFKKGKIKEKVVKEKKIKTLRPIKTDFEEDDCDDDNKKNQLFQRYPEEDFVKRLMQLFLGDELNLHYQFTRKTLEDKGVIQEINKMIPELQTYYLRCKHSKYLENVDSKKAITIFRQIIRVYGFLVKSVEKYHNRSKFLLYHVEKMEENKSPKKVNFEVNFD